MFFLEWHLMISMLEVQDALDFVGALFLEDVFNTGKMVCIIDCGIIDSKEVFHYSVFPWFFPGYWE